ncbi:MAG: polyribonucleotide nucleotidyltransferase [Deltaproteobacteria bacterium GWA2_38_16]|nr:MAG: polyribonucleotide nucleotidyltransferase [Deltaproteobacteria bacterium GWA2_38_16]OGQ03294.1 MAG: polyribonucleotide nucleotidyltransferase [Deltaproteobacteria bacterium RIFCSPHIGHO2_02_FULL_38_15]
MNTHVKRELFGKTWSIDIHKVAKQANGAVLIRCGDTVVLVTAVMSKDVREGQDFFPLTVDFQEKFYAAGRIPGGFFKREAKPSSKATLTARLIDRPLRPLFPQGFFNDVHIVATTLSVDGENDPDVLALIGASCALEISDIPFSGPVAAMRVGRVDGKFVANPGPELQKKSDIEILVSGSKHAVTMVEGGAKIVSEEDILEAILFAHREMQSLIQWQEELKKQYGIKKAEFTPPKENTALKESVEKLCVSEFSKIVHLPGKSERSEKLSQLKKEVVEKLLATVSEEEKEAKKEEIKNFFDLAKEHYARSYTLKNKKRIDERSYATIRPITIEVGLLPRTHGSALFTRGETQALAIVTLGTSEDEQRIDSIEGESSQSFMLHYNFPPFSTGETGFLRGPGRREIGHGALAERALQGILPDAEKFPYTIRVVSEILESNGSSSMASVCGGTLALMDAGVPIVAPVAGIAMGLIKEGSQVAVLSDILGDEDGFGDMDFKVAGTQVGVTALQMDIKIEGVTEDIMRTALAQAKEGRLFILNKMKEALAQSRSNLSPHAPRIYQLTVPKDKIRDVIGSGGKTIRGIIEATGAKIDIDDDGVVNIASNNEEALQKAIEIVKGIVTDPEVGKVYKGKVIKIMDFGAFVEILPNREGLVHISELSLDRVNQVTDIVKEGDELDVKVLEIDRQGKIRLSHKVLLEGYDETKHHREPPPPRDSRDRYGKSRGPGRR